jgi:methylmalonyl-CoA/ethylmalonyl-CoA epimerase
LIEQHRIGDSVASGRRVSRLDHVGIAVESIDAALTYYTDQLGLTVVHDEVADDPGVRLCYVDGGDTFIQLVEPIRPGPVREFLDSSGEGLHHLCFATDDLDSALVEWPGQEDARVFMGGRDRRACFVLGNPEGVIIELTEEEPQSQR